MPFQANIKPLPTGQWELTTTDGHTEVAKRLHATNLQVQPDGSLTGCVEFWTSAAQPTLMVFGHLQVSYLSMPDAVRWAHWEGAQADAYFKREAANGLIAQRDDGDWLLQKWLLEQMIIRVEDALSAVFTEHQLVMHSCGVKTEAA